MNTVTFPKNAPFDALTGELLPDYRDAYLHGQLTPVPTQQVEAYLSRSPIQKSMLLGRYHELLALATQRGRTLVPPRWVQRQLERQASYSAAGPLRQPLLRGVLGVLGLLCLASGVQWLRNEPLLPAPVAAAVERVAASARVATRQLVRQLSSPNPPPEPAPAPRRATAVADQPRSQAARPELAALAPLAPLAAASVALPPDSLLAQVPVRLEAPATAAAPVVVTVHGRISDTGGQPLPGATVLAQGTQLAASASASGDYSLTVPTGALLQFGCGGYADQILPATNGTLDVTLAPAPKPKQGRRR